MKMIPQILLSGLLMIQPCLAESPGSALSAPAPMKPNVPTSGLDQAGQSVSVTNYEYVAQTNASRGLGGWLAGLMRGDNAGASNVVVRVTPGQTDEILANPGVGWETFNRSSREDKNLPAWIPSTIYYGRWGWGKLEPQPGKIDTDFLDGELKKSRDAGQKLAFRVMCCSTYKNRPYLPDWLKKVGGRVLVLNHAEVTGLPVPDFDDPVALKYHLDFIRRLGARYDGHPDLDHVDLGSVGWWGEWHMSRSKLGKMPTQENQMKIVNAYLESFKRTPLVMLLNGKECTIYATQHGAGWRIDSMGDLGSFSAKWNHMRNAYPLWIQETKVQEVWKTAPIAYEPPNDISEMVEKQFPLRWIFNYALALHGSSYNGKSGTMPSDEKFQSELKRFLQRLGYRLVLDELKHPAQAQPGSPFEIAMKWQNTGSAPCYKPYQLAYRLTNDKGYQKVIVSPLTVNHWLPGTIELFNADFFEQPKDLPPGPVYQVMDTVKLPDDILPGEYTVSVGVVEAGHEQPVVRLGNIGRNQEGWYPVSPLRIAN